MFQVNHTPCKLMLTAGTLVLGSQTPIKQCVCPHWLPTARSMLVRPSPIAVVVLAHDSDHACTQHVSRCLSNRLLLATFPTLHPCIAMLTCMANLCSVCSTPCPQQPVCTCAPHSPSSCALTWHWRPHAPPDAVAPARRTQGSGCQKAMAAQHSYYSWLAGWQAVVAGC